MNTIPNFAKGIVKALRFILADRRRFFILLGIMGIIGLLVAVPFLWDTVAWAKYFDWLGNSDPEAQSITSENYDVIVNVSLPQKLTPSDEGYRLLVEVVNNGTIDVQTMIEIDKEQSFIFFKDQQTLPIRLEGTVPAGEKLVSPEGYSFEVTGINGFSEDARFKVRAFFDGELDWGRHFLVPIDFITIPLIVLIVLLAGLLWPVVMLLWKLAK